MASSEHFVNLPLARIYLLLIGYIVLRQVIANDLADTSETEIWAKLGWFNQSQYLTANCALLDAKLRHVASRESVRVDAQELQELSRRSTGSKACNLKYSISFLPDAIFLLVIWFS